MVSEPNTGQCVSEEADLRKGVDMRRCNSKDTRPQQGVDWGIPHQLEKEKSARKDVGP